MTRSETTKLETSSLSTTNERIQKWLEAPKFHYDMSFDLRALQNALRAASFLNDSGYKSLTEDEELINNQPMSTSRALQMYGTGWMVADNLSVDSYDCHLADEWGWFLRYFKIKKNLINYIKDNCLNNNKKMYSLSYSQLLFAKKCFFFKI